MFEDRLEILKEEVKKVKFDKWGYTNTADAEEYNDKEEKTIKGIRKYQELLLEQHPQIEMYLDCMKTIDKIHNLKRHFEYPK